MGVRQVIIGLWFRVVSSVLLALLFFSISAFPTLKDYVSYKSPEELNSEKIARCAALEAKQTPPECNPAKLKKPVFPTLTEEYGWLFQVEFCEKAQNGEWESLQSEYNCNEKQSDTLLSTESSIPSLKPLVEVLPYTLIVFIATFSLLSVISRWLNEQSAGWRRLVVVISPVVGVVASLVAYYSSDNLDTTIIIFITGSLIPFFALGYGKPVLMWIREGFQSDSTGQASPMPSPDAPCDSNAPLQAQEPVIKVRRASFWNRLLARCIDTSLVYLMFNLSGSLLSIPSSFDYSSFPAKVLFAIASATVFAIFVLLYDLFWLALTATTPGKSLFAMKLVTRIELRPLTFNEVYYRTLALLKSGLFFMIFFPYLQAYGAARAYRTLMANKTTKWDGTSYLVVERQIGAIRWVLGLWVAIALITFTVGMAELSKQAHNADRLNSLSRN